MVIQTRPNQTRNLIDDIPANSRNHNTHRACQQNNSPLKNKTLSALSRTLRGYFSAITIDLILQRDSNPF